MVPFLSTPTTSLSSHPCHGSCQNLSPRPRCGAAYSIYSVSSHYSSLTCSLPVIYLSQLLAVPSFHLVSSETVDSSVTPFFLLHTLSNLPGKPGTLVFKTYQESNSSPHHHYYPRLSHHLLLPELLWYRLNSSFCFGKCFCVFLPMYSQSLYPSLIFLFFIECITF